MPKTVLVVAAHSDDEVLGCGGTIAKHRANGDRIEVAFLTDGVSSRHSSGDIERSIRMEAARKAANILGVHNIHQFTLPDNEMDSLPLIEIVRVVESVCTSTCPEVVYTHHHGDLNIDHRLTHQAVMTACRPQPGQNVKEILGFEVLSSTEWNTAGVNPFLPNLFVDISPFLECKLNAIAAYKDEMRSAPHSRSVEHTEILAKHRGFSVGFSAAEAFEIYRLLR